MPAAAPLTEPSKSYLQVALADVEDARDALGQAERRLDEAMRRAIAGGHQVAAVARWSGLSRETVYQRTRR